MRCLEENTLFDFLRDGLDPAGRARVVEHAGGCDGCRALIAAAADVASGAPADEPSWMAEGSGDPPAALPSSDRLLGGKYRLVRLLGAGGMGAVHEAVNTWTGRRVAVKELHGEYVDDEIAVLRFDREARSASRIVHPNVVEVLDLGEDPITGGRFIVQELLTGSTLRHRLQARGRLSAGEALDLLRPALAGLAVAHGAGVVHRDLKPENIFLARDEAGGEVLKLIDFGLSKVVRQPDELDITEHGRQLGTPFYMSPEALRGEEVDDRTDVWSIGVVLFEAVAGARPFPGPSYGELALQVLGQPVPDLAAAAPDVPAAFAALVARALERDRRDRIGARELGEALDELGRAPDGLPPGNPYRGLAPFDEADRGLFFGRSTEIAAIRDRLRRSRFVLVAGDTGVGKTSLLRAGVVPRLREGTAGLIAPVVPGRDPVGALAAALAPILGESDADVARLVRDPELLAARVQQRLGDGALVLVVDPLEDLLGEGGGVAAAALAALLLRAPSVRLLGAAGSDWLARLSGLTGLGERVTAALYLLRPLGAAALRETVLGPARLTGLRLEPALVDELLGPAGRAADHALVHFALAELWAGRVGAAAELRADALASLGGVAGALPRHADGVLALIPADQRDQARGMLTSLVGPDGRRVARTAADLTGAGGDRAAGRVVLQILVEGGLVAAGEPGPGEPTVALAHDALIERWDTLRGWLGRQVERDAVRQRLVRAAAEWERLDRPVDALWRRRQLLDAADLDPLRLGPVEGAFLDRSRRAERRSRIGRRALVLGVPLLIGLGVAGAKVAAATAVRRSVDRRVAEAELLLRRAAADELALGGLRGSAFAAFDRGERAPGEEAWSASLEQEAALDATYADAAQELEAALAQDGARADVRRRFADVLLARADLADRGGRATERDEQVRRMLTYDDGAHRASWEAPAHLTVTSSPVGAEVALHRYVEERGRLRPGPARRLGVTPLRDVELARGSYLLVVRARDRPAVRAPVLLARGERLSVDVPIPLRVPAGTVYVPPGRFLHGSSDAEDMRRTMMNAQPLHPVSTAGYFIGRTEVTFGEWIEFLRQLPPAERAARMPGTPESASNHTGAYLALREDGGRFALSMQPTTVLHDADEGTPIRYRDRDRAVSHDWRRLPVSGIHWDDALAYTAWLDRTGRLPGARPCDEREWERAARGADGRPFPTGDRLESSDADLAESYGRVPGAFGPDQVGSHPASDSPFGVADLAGNAWEWVRSTSGDVQVVIRGGSWYHNALAARSNNREPSEPSLRALVIGLRVCAGAAAVEERTGRR